MKNLQKLFEKIYKQMENDRSVKALGTIGANAIMVKIGKCYYQIVITQEGVLEAELEDVDEEIVEAL